MRWVLRVWLSDGVYSSVVGDHDGGMVEDVGCEQVSIFLLRVFHHSRCDRGGPFY